MLKNIYNTIFVKKDTKTWMYYYPHLGTQTYSIHNLTPYT